MNAPEPCPAILHDRPEERVICFLVPHVPGALGFVCRRCLEAMLEGEADREAQRQEWELEP